MEKRRKKQLKHYRRKVSKALLLTALLIAAGILVVGGLLSARQPSQESVIISEQGIHWHVDLTINVFGQYQEIPANIGLGFAEKPIHTHERDHIIHLEFPGLVQEDAIRLGQFFDIWGKRFDGECILSKCSGADGELKMFVNGEPNFEFENYTMGDGDKIEIILER